MLDLRKQLTLSHAVASQLIGHDHARYILKTLQQLSEESLRGFGVPAWLNEDIEHDAGLADAHRVADEALARRLLAEAEAEAETG